MGNATCAVEGCGKPFEAKGFCAAHYSRWKNHGDPLAGGVPRARYPKGERPGCAVDGCGKPVRARGWCIDHYQRWKNHGDPLGGRAARGTLSSGPCKADGCANAANGGRGWCKRHYQRYYLTGDALTPDKYTRRGAPILERLEVRIVKTGYCWFWTGKPNSGGYGVIGITEEGVRKVFMAHRVAYEVFVGPIPDGLVLDHLCRNRACVNPDHLEPVTQEVNVQRGAASDPHTHCRKGHEYTPENTRVVQICLTCDRDTRERRRRRRRAALQAA